ncbi:hypothetical protein ACFSTC_23340 [Nonomuraea ferruginea]
MPDQALLAYGRSLCGVYTRDDPRELARVESVEGLRVRDLYWAIDDICPAAAAKVKTEREADDQEFAAFQAEERAKCAATPRHRPLIEPVKAVRLDDPVWPEIGLEMRDTAGTGDSGGGRARRPGRVRPRAPDGLGGLRVPPLRHPGDVLPPPAGGDEGLGPRHRGQLHQHGRRAGVP